MGMFVSLTVNGLAMGMIYSLMAMGLVLLVRSVGVMNFAQGDFLMMGGYVSFGYIYMLKVPELLGVGLSIVTYSLIGIVFMRVFYWPLRYSKWGQSLMVCTIGASMIFKDTANILFGPEPKIMKPIVAGALKIGHVTLQYQFLIIIAVSLCVIVAVFTLFDRMYVGRVLQAASQNKYAAELIGIPTAFTMAATYMIVMMIAGIGGYLVGPVFLVTTTLGTLQLKAFAGVIIGGFGSLKGTIIGCIIVGLVESYSTYLTMSYKEVIVYIVLLLTLLIRPQGFFGESIAEKA